VNRKALNAARRGAAFLDSRYKTWRRRVNLDRLDLGSGSYVVGGNGCGCVLAQIDAVYTHGEGDFSDRLARLGLAVDDARRLGFLGSGAIPHADLDEAWRRVLA
jgi:hypothetical protein